MQALCSSWGIEDLNMFASATLQRPFNRAKAVHLAHENMSLKDIYDMQMRGKERIKQFLSDTEKIPKELVRAEKRYLMM